MIKDHLKTLNFLVLCGILLALASTLEPGKVTPELHPKLSYVPQFVLISFDGARSNDLWKDLREFHEELKQKGTRLHYTFFMNTAYLLTEDTRNIYIGPGHLPGKTNIGISQGIEDIRTRIIEMNLAIAQGHEIAPHTTGHFSGASWTKEDWKNELASFDGILFGLDKLYPDAKLPKLNLKPEDVVGFRAPYLDTSPGLFEYFHETPKYRYDSSQIGGSDAWPTKDDHGLWRIPLGMMFAEHGTRPVLAMDYNHYVLHSGAQDLLKKGTPEWQEAHDDILAAWFEYFTRNYTKNRVPVLMGYHFGQWNDGLYWDVMKQFARKVCGMPEVECGTFKELVNYLDEYGVPSVTGAISKTN